METPIVKQYRGCGYMTVSRFNNTGDLLYIGDKDSKIITVIELKRMMIIGSFEGHCGIILSIDISEDDEILVSCSGDLSVIFWEAKTGILLKKVIDTMVPKYISIQKLKKNNYVAIYYEGLINKNDNKIQIYDLINLDNPIQIIECTGMRVNIMRWFTCERLILGCDDGSINIIDINDNEYLEKYKFHEKGIRSFDMNKNSTELLTGSLDNKSKIIDINKWEVKEEFNLSYPINYAIYSKNNKKVIIGGGNDVKLIANSETNDLNLKFINIKSKKVTQEYTSHFGPIKYIDKCKNNNILVTASQDGTVKIYLYEEYKDMNEYDRFGIGLEKSDNELLLSDVSINITTNGNNIIKKKEEPKSNWIVGMPKPKEVIEKSLFKIKEREIINEPEIINTTLKISNLPNDIDIDSLKDLLEMYGRITDMSRLKYYDSDTILYVTYSHKDSCDKAIKMLDKKKMGYMIIDVDYHKSKK